MNYELIKYLVIIIWIISAIAYFGIGYYKTKEIIRWLIVGLICGPLALIFVLTCPKNKFKYTELRGIKLWQ